ncbi:hypothetical protein RSOLAG22IIIB_06850 [Rhizoctonia solani]|uniref:t-SNARE coiled-coil homology domain-containing protein n=1 Tax=Rhizoctonia solani TaxID=456999 RepID=A0A0K6GH06_9AGAM|nr:hypothetical protein RSOLAG22IIIB_06850 [Rhizoctonia solani]
MISRPSFLNNGRSYSTGLAPLEQVALQAAQELNRYLQEIERRSRLDLVSQRTRIDNNKHRIGGIDYVLHRIDQHSLEVNQHIAVIDERLDEATQGFDGTDQRFDEVNLALEGANQRMDSIQAELAIIERISHARTLNASITQDTAELVSILLGNGRTPDRDLNRIPRNIRSIKDDGGTRRALSSIPRNATLGLPVMERGNAA